jgi:putative endonuclease
LPRQGGVKSITTDRKTMWQVYVLKSIQGKRYYIGCTDNLDRRLSEHNKGYNIATEKDRPWVVVHSEKFNNKLDAYAREKKIKSYKSGNAFRKLLNL